MPKGLAGIISQSVWFEGFYGGYDEYLLKTHLHRETPDLRGAGRGRGAYKTCCPKALNSL